MCKLLCGRSVWAVVFNVLKLSLIRTPLQCDKLLPLRNLRKHQVKETVGSTASCITCCHVYSSHPPSTPSAYRATIAFSLRRLLLQDGPADVAPDAAVHLQFLTDLHLYHISVCAGLPCMVVQKSSIGLCTTIGPKNIDAPTELHGILQTGDHYSPIRLCQAMDNSAATRIDMPSTDVEPQPPSSTVAPHLSTAAPSLVSMQETSSSDTSSDTSSDSGSDSSSDSVSEWFRPHICTLRCMNCFWWLPLFPLVHWQCLMSLHYQSALCIVFQVRSKSHTGFLSFKAQHGTRFLRESYACVFIYGHLQDVKGRGSAFSIPNGKQNTRTGRPESCLLVLICAMGCNPRVQGVPESTFVCLCRNGLQSQSPTWAPSLAVATK